jgi:hypothetical protein
LVRGCARLLGQRHDAIAVELGDAEVLGIGNRGEQDERVGAVGAEGGDEVVDPALQQVVAQVHDEGVDTQEGLGGEHRMGQPSGLVLDDVGDLDPELRAVAGASRISSPVSGAMMIPTSSMPAWAIASMP